MEIIEFIAFVIFAVLAVEVFEAVLNALKRDNVDPEKNLEEYIDPK